MRYVQDSIDLIGCVPWGALTNQNPAGGGRVRHISACVRIRITPHKVQYTSRKVQYTPWVQYRCVRACKARKVVGTTLLWILCYMRLFNSIDLIAMSVGTLINQNPANRRVHKAHKAHKALQWRVRFTV